MQWRDPKAPGETAVPCLAMPGYLLFDVDIVIFHVIMAPHISLVDTLLAGLPLCPGHQPRSDHARCLPYSIDCSTRLASPRLEPQPVRRCPKIHMFPLLPAVAIGTAWRALHVLAPVRPAHQATLEAWARRAASSCPRAGLPQAASSSHPCQPWTSALDLCEA